MKVIMKKNSTKTIWMALAIAATVTACGGAGSKSQTEAETTETEAEEVSYSVDTVASEVAWKGEVAGVYGHNGVIEIKSGTVAAKGNQITRGEVIIDMTSIQPLDSASYKDEDGRRATDLVGHLSTGDFFLVEDYPTSSFVIKSYDGTKLTGDLTIRGTTKEATADVTAIEVTDSALSAKATLVFDRQDFGVSWVHYMKDMVLSDDITINLDIKATK